MDVRTRPYDPAKQGMTGVTPGGSVPRPTGAPPPYHSSGYPSRSSYDGLPPAPILRDEFKDDLVGKVQAYRANTKGFKGGLRQFADWAFDAGRKKEAFERAQKALVDHSIKTGPLNWKEVGLLDNKYLGQYAEKVAGIPGVSDENIKGVSDQIKFRKNWIKEFWGWMTGGAGDYRRMKAAGKTLLPYLVNKNRSEGVSLRQMFQSNPSSLTLEQLLKLRAHGPDNASVQPEIIERLQSYTTTEAVTELPQEVLHEYLDAVQRYPDRFDLRGLDPEAIQEHAAFLGRRAGTNALRDIAEPVIKQIREQRLAHEVAGYEQIAFNLAAECVKQPLEKLNRWTNEVVNHANRGADATGPVNAAILSRVDAVKQAISWAQNYWASNRPVANLASAVDQQIPQMLERLEKARAQVAPPP